VAAQRREVLAALDLQIEVAGVIAATDAPEMEKAFRLLQLSFFGDSPLDSEAALRILQT
jgi:hypothetical protein